MKKCTFSYKPTYLFLSASNSLDEVKMKIIYGQMNLLLMVLAPLIIKLKLTVN